MRSRQTSLTGLVQEVLLPLHDSVHRVQAPVPPRLGANVRSSRKETIFVPLDPDLAAKKKKRRRKKKAEEKEGEEEESSIDPIPIVCAVMVASVFGGPVCLIANLKLGMFVAIGGGIIGYTTGRMFSDHG